MLEKNTLLKGALILLIALAVLQVIQPTVLTIDTSTLASWQTDIILVVQHFFRVTPVALLAGFAWSLFGFLRYKFGDSTVQYELTKMNQTLIWFEGILIIVAAGLPTPIALAVSGVIMATKSVLSTYRSVSPLPTTPQTATPAETGPGPPSPS